MFGGGSKTRETQDDAKWNTRNRVHSSVRFFDFSVKSWARCRKFPSESAHRGRLSVDPESSACRKCRLGPITPCADCETTIPHPQTCQVYKPASSSIFRGFSSSVVFLSLVLFSDAASPVLAIARRKTFFLRSTPSADLPQFSGESTFRTHRDAPWEK